jgi:hypothetical protein
VRTNVRKDGAGTVRLTPHDGGGRLVAARLDAENCEASFFCSMLIK